MPNALRVDVLLNGQRVSTRTFRQDSILVGSAPDCDVRLDEAGVSAHHARVERAGEDYLLHDLTSSGTIVGGRAVSVWSIPDGGKARISEFELQFHLVDAARSVIEERDEAGAASTDPRTRSAIESDIEPLLPKSQREIHAPPAATDKRWIAWVLALGAALAAAMLYLALR